MYNACGARPGPKRRPHPLHVRHRRGVPRADVRVERLRVVERLRAEPPAVHADGTRWHVSARMHARPIARAHARAHGCSTWARECGGPARTDDPFIAVPRFAWM